MIDRRDIARLLVIGSLQAAGALAASAAWADDFVVYSPYVIDGQTEFEFRGHDSTDSDPSLDGEQAYQFAFGHAFTDWWRPEIYVARYAREPSGTTRFQGYEFENVFQLAPAGEWWADTGFLASYEYNGPVGAPADLEFGPLFEKRIGRLRQRLNLIWEKELGSHAAGQYAFRGTYALNYLWRTGFAPGLEAYYRPADDSRQLGPSLYGELYLGDRRSELEYSAALLLGLNRGAPDKTLVLRLEYEFF
jgi:hypothetical protein